MTPTSKVMHTFSPKQVRIQDRFWSDYQRLVKEVVIPYQYDALHDRIADAEPSYAIRNLEIAAGRCEGEFHGFVFQDTDVAKWIEAVAYSLMTAPDAELERMTDEVIALIAEAQGQDGYLNTYFTIKEPDKRWTNLVDCHELYTAGHMIEAGVAYYEATGKRQLLDVVCRLADHIDGQFGAEAGKRRGYDGHQEIELALVKLYRLTGEKRYVQLSQFFIDERGQEPNYLRQEWERRDRYSFYGGAQQERINLEYCQAHLPVREQKVAIGHAVRAVYMYTAMADLARLNGDERLHEACRTLWRNIVDRQMYIIGGIGSTHHGEAFTFDYDLPNDTVYAETCAAVGLVFFAFRMLQLEPHGEYGDVLERALYNNVIGGMSQDGRHYFYVNPLEVWPAASHHNPDRQHVKPVRQKWFGCSCCPPNVARLLASLGQYVYTSANETIYTHLFIGSETTVGIGDRAVTLRQTTEYPWQGTTRFSLQVEHPLSFTLALRLPGWCQRAKLLINGEPIDYTSMLRHSYVHIQRQWTAADTIEWSMDMDVQVMYAHPELRANAGRIALQRGPLVYCIEAADNEAALASLAIQTELPLQAQQDDRILNGCIVITGTAVRERMDDEQRLYRLQAPERVKQSFTAIPYFLWGNRGEGEMSVWLRKA
ncbi:glycoside hydrolase family 127 protein [Paenibacillus sp. SGZ-1009]|uniref:glycoside hydrolase family 127 protein n=1 Tax=Paenibacillus campi TaxID=3106031 RepID=UPI002AFE8766|nr:beta-L-arabinofuranosidase domain-containing protein [Paenibacillus sp. SGZ-1009]